MGWLRLVGSLKLQVSFPEYRLFYRALLQKRRVILRSLLIAATPYEISCYMSVVRLSACTVNTYDQGCLYLCIVHVHLHTSYGVATISRLLKMIGLFYKRAL